MTSPGISLPDFLLARFAEDEEDALDASSRDTVWCVEESRAAEGWGAYEGDAVVLGGGKPLAVCDPQYGGGLVAAHIARHDPARVLAECDAKRRIVNSRPAIGTPGACLHVVHDEVQRQREYVWKLLALAYSDHPDYDESWRP